MKLTLRPAARRELTDALKWHADNTAYAAEFASSISTVLDRIVDNPMQFARVRGFNDDTDLRRGLILRFNFVVVYRVTPAKILVIAIHHTSRDPDYWHKRL